jgi:uncharacterized protein
VFIYNSIFEISNFYLFEGMGINSQIRVKAALGDAAAQFNLGVMYYEGQGVQQDYTQAYMWVNLATAQGVEDAVRMRDNLVKKLTPSQIEEG